MRRIAAVALGLLTLSGSMAGEVAKTPVPGSPDSLARPTRGQVEYLGMELQMFVCLDPCTWQNRDYDNHLTPLSAINPAKLNTAYNQVFRQQLTEVLSRYGQISEVWFDGSCVIEVGDVLKQHAPGAMVFQGPHTTLRWVGNEAGYAPYPAWQTVKRADAATGIATAAHSDPDGDVWLPMECDTTLLDHKWFWGEDTDDMRKSLDQLMDIYYKSVGRGCVLLLNLGCCNSKPAGTMRQLAVQIRPG